MRITKKQGRTASPLFFLYPQNSLVPAGFCSNMHMFYDVLITINFILGIFIFRQSQESVWNR